MSTINIPLIVRRSQLKSIVGISPTQVDRLEVLGKFPKRVKFSPGVVGWHGPAVEACIEETVRAAQSNKKT